MLRDLLESWRRLITGSPAPAYVLIRPASARSCPECGSGYAAGERYCPGCRASAPEWRFG
jgi:hypothetical protein